MIRFDVEIHLSDVDAATARKAIESHHRNQPFSGDSFMPSKQLDAHHLGIEIDGDLVGVAAVDDESLSLCVFDPAVKRLDRQIMETFLAETGVVHAYAVSWDRWHMDLFGNFARAIENQAYQFELLRPAGLKSPVQGLGLSMASPSDLPYLDATGFQDDFGDQVASGAVRVARLNGTEVGIAMLVPHALNRQRVDIGMFTNPEQRRKGIGRSILAVASEEVLAAGATPVAGCWAGNWESRPALEAAGLTCTGTIFRFTLDPDRFRVA